MARCTLVGYTTLPTLFYADVDSFGYVYCTCFGFVNLYTLCTGSHILLSLSHMHTPFFVLFSFLVDVKTKNKDFAKKKKKLADGVQQFLVIYTINSNFVGNIKFCKSRQIFIFQWIYYIKCG